MKRWIALVLVCVFFINLLPLQAAAVEDDFVYISVVHDGREKSCRVIKDGAQLLFAGEDLASFGGYTYSVEGDNAYFSRGMKTIRVNMARSSLIPYDGTTYSEKQKNITLKTSVRNIDGTNYFSGTQLLPWLSVNCSVEEGKLNIVSDEITLWELIGDFDPEDYTFDFAKCCEELGENSKWVKAWAGIQGFGIDSILGWLPSLGGNSKEEHYYYDIFEDMLQDQTCTESSLDELMEDIEKCNQWMEWIEILGMEEELPDELRAMGAIFKGIGSKPNQFGVKLGFYMTTIEQDNQVKLNALKYIVLHGTGFPQSMDAAAQTIIVEYEDYILGILGKTIDTLTDYLKGLMGDLSDKLAFKMVMKAIDFPESVSSDLYKEIRRVDFYDTIAKGSAVAYKEERDRLSDAAVSSMGIQNTRSIAYLYLYVTEQNWRAMYDYAMHVGKYEFAKEYALRADAAEEMAAQFLASAYAQLNDSPKYGDGEVQRKQAYTDLLKEMFAQLDYSTESKNVSQGLIGYIGGEISEVVSDLGNAFMDEYYSGGRCYTYNDLGISFFFGDTERFGDTQVFSVRAWKDRDYGYGLSARMTYPEIVTAASSFVSESIPKPEEYYNEIDGWYEYSTSFVLNDLLYVFWWTENPEFCKSYEMYVTIPYTSDVQKLDSESSTHEERYKINVFLSNFSEQWFNEYDPITYETTNTEFTIDRLNTDQLINFAFFWYNLNAWKSVEITEDFMAALTFDQINEKTERYFGVTLSRSDFTQSSYETRGNKIVKPYGVGESYPNFTVANEIVDNGNGTYLVIFKIYSLKDAMSGGNRVSEKEWYCLTEADASKSADLNYHASGYATVKPYTQNNADSYQLVSYCLDWQNANCTNSEMGKSITKEEARNLAYAYWDCSEDDTDLYVVEQDSVMNDGVVYYVYSLSWMVYSDDGSPSHLSTIDWLYINSETGECSNGF